MKKWTVQIVECDANAWVGVRATMEVEARYITVEEGTLVFWDDKDRIAMVAPGKWYGVQEAVDGES